MVSCVVRRCGNTSAKASKNKDGITFHRFPRDASRRALWERAVDRDQWSATAASCVCSQHFVSRDFYLTENGLRRLRVDAVPAVNISVCQEVECCLIPRSAAPEVRAEDAESDEGGAGDRAGQEGDRASDVAGPNGGGTDDRAELERLRRKVRRLEALAADRKRRLNLLWQSKRRLQGKVEKLTALLRQLIQKE